MNLNGINFEKISRILEMDDVEDAVGTYFNDSFEPTARRLVNDQYNKRFALRHPWLTGIPTLGIAPLHAKEKAVEEIKRQIIRKNSAIRSEHFRYQQAMRERQLEDLRMQIEMDKANAIPNAVRNAGTSYVLGKAIEYDR